MTQASVGSFLIALLRRALPETLVIIAVGTAGGFVLNSRQIDPLPLDLPASLLLVESGAEAVFLSRARQLFEEGEYIFVDVRSEERFRAGHIEGAFSLPVERFAELYPLLQTWTGGQPILVYGAARDIPLVDDLAKHLIESGEESVARLAAGYAAWVARGYPVETGSEGLLDQW
jgi:rhodanese-related sulfurtransferase